LAISTGFAVGGVSIALFAERIKHDVGTPGGEARAELPIMRGWFVPDFVNGDDESHARNLARRPLLRYQWTVVNDTGAS